MPNMILESITTNNIDDERLMLSKMVNFDEERILYLHHFLCSAGDNAFAFRTACSKKASVYDQSVDTIFTFLTRTTYVNGNALLYAHVSEMMDATYGQQQPQRASTSNVNRPSISNHGLYAAEFQSFV
ncbi:hypothetical protein Tco_0313722 [Tanacetum coccineum]